MDEGGGECRLLPFFSFWTDDDDDVEEEDSGTLSFPAGVEGDRSFGEEGDKEEGKSVGCINMLLAVGETGISSEVDASFFEGGLDSSSPSLMASKLNRLTAVDVGACK
jgi:hypothetical protein